MKKYWKKLMAVMVSCMMFLGLGSVVSAAEYPDVNPGDWYYEYVQDVSEKGLMSGYTDTGKFGPNDKLTRGQFATILWRMAGSPEAAYNGQFPDVAGNEFYGAAVAWASENGIITGYTDSGKFGPNDNINREQMATILYRYDGSPEVDLSSYAGFPDAGSVNVFAQNGMAYAVSNQIVTGDNGYLVPQGTVVRAVCATMISRFSDSHATEPSPEPTPDPEPQPEPEFDIQAWADKNGFVYNSTDAGYVKTIDGVRYECSYGMNPNDPEGTEARWNIWVTDGKAASGSVVIPESIDGVAVTGIGYGAFINNETITDITIPATVTKIVETAFTQTEIATYTFQGGVPEGFQYLRPTNRNITVRYPGNVAEWAEFKFVYSYFTANMVAY